MNPVDAEHTARFATEEADSLLDRHAVLTGKDIAVRRYVLLEAFVDHFKRQLVLWEAQHDALTRRFVEERRKTLME